MQLFKLNGVVFALAIGAVNIAALYKYHKEWEYLYAIFGGEIDEQNSSEEGRTVLVEEGQIYLTDENFSSSIGDTVVSSDTAVSSSSVVESISKTQPNDNGITKKNKEEDKVFVLHVGPHKTGSTSLQEFIFRNNLVKDSLERDNYMIPLFHYGEFGFERDPKNHAVFAHCFLDELQNNFCPPDIRTKVLGEFKSFMDEAVSEGANVIMSSEAFLFESLNTTEFTNYISPEYKIHIVVFYRRFYDWARSTYNQRSKAPLENGMGFLPFPKWLEKKMSPLKSKYSAAVRDRFQNVPRVSNISVENLHKKEDSVSSAQKFFCTHVDNGPHLCDLAKNEKMKHDNLSPSLDELDLKRLHNHILSHQKIDLPPDDRTRWWKKIDDKFRNSVNLPRICIDDELKEKLLHISVEYEIALTQESWHNSPEGLDNLRDDFGRKVSSDFCAVDVEALVASQEWKEFLEGL